MGRSIGKYFLKKPHYASLSHDAPSLEERENNSFPNFNDDQLRLIVGYMHKEEFFVGGGD